MPCPRVELHVHYNTYTHTCTYELHYSICIVSRIRLESLHRELNSPTLIKVSLRVAWLLNNNYNDQFQ